MTSGTTWSTNINLRMGSLLPLRLHSTFFCPFKPHISQRLSYWCVLEHNQMFLLPKQAFPPQLKSLKLCCTAQRKSFMLCRKKQWNVRRVWQANAPRTACSNRTHDIVGKWNWRNCSKSRKVRGLFNIHQITFFRKTLFFKKKEIKTRRPTASFLCFLCTNCTHVSLLRPTHLNTQHE